MVIFISVGGDPIHIHQSKQPFIKQNILQLLDSCCHVYAEAISSHFGQYMLIAIQLSLESGAWDLLLSYCKPR